MKITKKHIFVTIIFMFILLLAILLLKNVFLLEPHITGNDYFSIEAIPCRYVLRGENRKFEITCVEDEIGAISINDFFIEGASADMTLKRKSQNNYILTLKNIYPNKSIDEYKTTENTNGNEFHRGLECSIIFKPSIHNENYYFKDKKYDFYISDSYLYCSDKVHRNIFTNTMSFDLIYKGNNIITLNENDFRLENFTADMELYRYRYNHNKIKVKLKNIEPKQQSSKYTVYISGGTSVTVNGELVNAETTQLDIDLTTLIKRVENSPAIILLIALITAITAISTTLNLIIDINTILKMKRKHINEKQKLPLIPNNTDNESKTTDI